MDFLLLSETEIWRVLALAMFSFGSPLRPEATLSQEHSLTLVALSRRSLTEKQTCIVLRRPPSVPRKILIRSFFSFCLRLGVRFFSGYISVLLQKKGPFWWCEIYKHAASLGNFCAFLDERSSRLR